MISLSLPTEDQNIYVLAYDYLLGPIRIRDTSPMDTISVRTGNDSISPGNSYAHEHDVSHYKTEGHLSVNPSYKDVVAAPTISDPARVSFNRRNLRTHTQGIVFNNHGLAMTGKYSTSKVGTSNFSHRVCISTTPTRNEFVWLDSGSATSSTLKVSVSHWVTELLVATDFTVTHRTITTDMKLGTELARDWFKVRSAAEVLNYFATLSTNVVRTPTLGNFDLLQCLTPLSMSFAALTTSIDSLIAAKMKDVVQPNFISPTFGDLASKASEGVNRNSVNMIAFLKDLRNPQQLIPKLKNLKKLKDHAGNFLAVNYGILPTISDLQEIAGAFKKIKPYIDKNGYSTYNAVHRDSRQVGDISFSLEKRIKIAIDNEDNEFVAFANKVHSSGFAPTLENVWDLIPYSFVIDWFVGVGDFLERVDSNLRLLRLNIKYSTMSSKTITTLPITGSASNPIFGTINVVTYRRWTLDQCPLPPLSFSSEITAQSHWLEASALILQRTKY